MSSSQPKTAPYGSWKSPITSDLIVAQSITLSEVRLDGGHVYWLEGRPQEQGRYVVVRAAAAAAPTDMTPRRSTRARASTNTAADHGPCGTAPSIFSNFADGRLYRQARWRIRAAAADAGAAGA